VHGLSSFNNPDSEKLCCSNFVELSIEEELPILFCFQRPKWRQKQIKLEVGPSEQSLLTINSLCSSWISSFRFGFRIHWNTILYIVNHRSRCVSSYDVSWGLAQGLDTSAVWSTEKKTSAVLSRLRHDWLICCKRSASGLSKCGCNAAISVSELSDGVVDSTARFLLKEDVDNALRSLDCKDRGGPLEVKDWETDEVAEAGVKLVDFS